MMDVKDEQIKALAEAAAADKKASRAKNRNGAQRGEQAPEIEYTTDLDTLLDALHEECGIEVTKEKPGNTNGTPCDVLQLSDCPFHPEDTHTAAAVLLSFDDGGLGFKCQGGRCKGIVNLRDLVDLLGLERKVTVSKTGGLKWGLARDIKTESVDLLWDDRIVVAHLNLLLGNEKVGKGVLECRLAEMATTGKLTGEPIHVAISSTEDRWSVTIKPRLEAAGADMDLVHTLLGLKLPDELPALEAGCVEQGVNMLFIDPIHAHFGRGLDFAAAKDTNYVLNALADVADRIGLTVIGLIHTNRTTSSNTRSRMAHSMEFGRVARSTIILGYAPDGAENERIIGHDMANYSARARSMNAAIEGVKVKLDSGDLKTHPAMSLDGPSDFTVDQILSHDIDTDDRQKQRAAAETQWSQAASEMRMIQRDHGSLEVPARKFKRLDYSNDTKQRAKRHIGIKSKKYGDGWLWVFPEPAADEDDDF